MARPKLLHDGFLIPNAGDVVNPKMAEPDRVDFNTVGNARWGVIEDCLVTVSGTTAMTMGGVAIINGILRTVANSSVLLGSSPPQDCFDLVGVNMDGVLDKVSGEPGDDPVFPDPPDDFTVLAAVFRPSGGANFSDNVIDKRNWLSDALLTKLDLTKPLIQNRNGSGDEFRVLGDGHMTWHEDTELSRSAAETLRVIRHLIVEGVLTVNDDIVAGGDVTAAGNATATNLRRGDVLPLDTDGRPGDLFQLTSTAEPAGQLFMYTEGKWQEMATVNGTVPVGTIIQSMESPSNMGKKGWVALNGDVIKKSQYPRLFDIESLQPFLVDADNMRLPDAGQRVLVTNFDKAGDTGGSSTVTLTEDNMAKHTHGITQTASGGAHDHGISIGKAGLHSHTTYGGLHDHSVSDPTHSHYGADWNGDPVKVIASVWGGQNKLDALFNDKSHTYNVEPATWLSPARSGVKVTSGSSDHGHNMHGAGDHAHTVDVKDVGGHTHAITSNPVGTNKPVTITPPFLTVFTYIRS